MAGSHVQADILLAQPPTAGLAAGSGSHFTEPMWVSCPSLPGAVVIPTQKPHGLKAGKGWVPKEAEGAGPRRKGQMQDGKVVPPCCPVGWS